MADSLLHSSSFPDKSRRRCPRCGQVKDLDLAHGGGEWYLRKRVRHELGGDGVIVDMVEDIASPYCRECTIKRSIGGRRRRAGIARLLKVTRSAEPRDLPAEWPGTCDICDQETTNILVVNNPTLGFLCWRCARLTGEGRRRLVEMWQILLGHNNCERELEAENVNDRRRREPRHRPVHKGNKLGPIEDHQECLDLEERVRLVLLWVLRAAVG